MPKGKRREALQGGLISQAYINGSLLEHEWVIIYDLKWGIVEQYNEPVFEQNVPLTN